MNIAFRLDANNRIGMGHAQRCMTLAAEFLQMGHPCVFFCKENQSLFSLLADHGFQTCLVPESGLPEEQEWLLGRLGGFSILILDSYQLSDAYIRAMRHAGRVVCCIDDNALYRYDCDIVLNGNLHASELRYRFGSEKPHMLLGGRYCLLRKEFQDAEPVTIRLAADTVFVCMGGSDPQNLTPFIVRELQKIPDIRIVAALGALTQCDRQVREVAGPQVTVVKSPPLLSRWMGSCDIGVTAAGSMVYELAVLGLPSLISIQAENQRLIADYMNRHRLMEPIGDSHDLLLPGLREACAGLLSDYPRRKAMHRLLRGAVAANGARRSAGSIISFAEGR